MKPQFSDMMSTSNFFWRCFISLVKFSYWSMFHAIIITGSGIMTVFFYKGMIRDPEIGNTPVWVLPNIWRLGWVMNAKFGTNVPNRMLLNAAKFQGYRWGGGGGGVISTHTQTHTLIRVNKGYSQSAVTCLKLTIETLERGLKYLQN